MWSSIQKCNNMDDGKIILGLIGEIASGKDEMARYLKEKYSSETFSFSDPMRKILDIMGLPQTRENIVFVAVAFREKYGADIWGKAIYEQCKNSSNNLISLPNIRLIEDTNYLREFPGFHLVNIETSPEIRYQRLTKRSQNPDDQTKTWEQFLADSELPTEKAIRETAKHGEFHLDNNGDLASFHKQIDELMDKLKSL